MVYQGVFKKKRTESKFEIFDQNHWLTGAHNPGYGLLLVDPFGNFALMIFLESRKPCFFV